MPGTAHAQRHPRRPLAHQSVSLRHSPPAADSRCKTRAQHQPTGASSPNPASDTANPPSSVSPKLSSSKKNSSGESSDAGKWFESTNNDAKQSQGAFVDNDPPFFLRNGSSSETPPEAGDHAYQHPTIPYRPILGRAGTNGSSTEDFRSVIDDLTVVNKKLKQKLKKYEKMYDAHLDEEKLFEVRFHGLPDHKKKELEETLRKFASSLDDGETAGYPQIASHAPLLQAHKSASSTSRFAESGYASMSASGQNSSATSNQDREHRKISKSAYSRQQQTIQSYLHDIPIGLLPNNNVLMSDKSKKKMVVRRLEQIFAGKRSVPGNHPQPMQQEEVAQSAATADREQREATGQQFRPEGSREARIMAEKGGDGCSGTNQEEAVSGPRPTLHGSGADITGSGSSPNQRPTRPLDLDPYRAQVPIENMEYIRHLGFTPPDMESGASPLLGHGWIYLNLLINMAQLHTLNVTPHFVKDALHEYSSCLEVSRDGRKIRWKGGRDVTMHSSGSSTEYSGGPSPEHPYAAGPTLTSSASGVAGIKGNAEHQARRIAPAKRDDEHNKFAYAPLFFHKEESDEEEDIEVDSTNNSLFQPQQAGNSSGFGSSAMQSASSKPIRRDDGPMIFYTKAKFCTDLSGDRLGATLINPGAYKAMTSHPIGATPSQQSASDGKRDLTESRGPLDACIPDTDSTTGDRAASSSGGFSFSPDSLIIDSGNNTPASVDFEASGLGGVHPEDNFSVHVRRSQVPTTSSGVNIRHRSSILPKHIANHLSQSDHYATKASLPRSRPHRAIKESILSTSRKSLPNSILPPASFLPFDSTSSGEMSDVESDGSSELQSDTEEEEATGLQILNKSPVGDSFDENSEEASQYSEDTDDGSVDLLVTARELDPTTIRASEREYDAALAERLAEVIPAGSSAATAGGGSGFNTPAHQLKVFAQSADGSAQNPARSPASSSLSFRARKLKRNRTSESMSTVLESGSKGVKSQKTNH